MEQAAAAITAIDKEAQYHDGLITFPAYLYEQLKQGLGIEFEPEYLDKETDPEIEDANNNHGQKPHESCGMVQNGLDCLQRGRDSDEEICISCAIRLKQKRNK